MTSMAAAVCASHALSLVTKEQLDPALRKKIEFFQAELERQKMAKAELETRLALEFQRAEGNFQEAVDVHHQLDELNFHFRRVLNELSPERRAQAQIF